MEAYNLPRKLKIIYNIKLNNIHFPYLKIGRTYSHSELIKLDDFLKSEAANDPRIDKEILSKEFIMKAYSQFKGV